MNKRLIIIDGHALMHRAWHALPPLTAKDGRVVSGAYGFTMILLKAIKELNPTHLVVTFDLAGPTFRHEEYSDYKATREKKPDELYEQFPIAEEILAAMDIPVYTAKGFEADDVIGTIAKRVVQETKDIEVIIVTGDKDTFQLVDKRTKVYTLRKGMTDTVLYDEAGVREKMGIRPDQLVDYKALRGDPSDNIPGVRGIGDKTAVTLLNQYETLDNLYSVLDDGTAVGISDSVRQKLIDGKDDAYMSQDLCQIRCDIELDFKLDTAVFRLVTREMVQDVFETYQFNRLLTQLPKTDSEEGRKIGGQLGFLATENTVTNAEAKPAELTAEDLIKVIADVKQAEKIITKFIKAKRLAFRTLSVDDEKHQSGVRFLGLSDGETVEVIEWQAVESNSEKLRLLLAVPERELICFDLKREFGIFASIGVTLSGQLFDLMIASYLLHAGERRHSLESMLSFLRNIPSPEKSADESSQVRRLAVELGQFKSLADEFQEQLAVHQLEEINRTMEIPLSAVLSRMERNGVELDVEYLNDLSEEIGQKIDKLTVTIHDLAGENFNINSPLQMKEVLFEKLHIDTAGIKKTEKGKTLSTAAAELDKIKDAHPIIEPILEYRELTKLKSTYIDALPPLTDPRTGRIHADFNQTVAATGRLSSSNPNLQNIPTASTTYGQKVRDAFVAESGFVLLAADYSQIELRIAAHMADEPTMIESFKNGEDIHWRTAAEMFGEDKAKENRRIAKAINFGILYGMGAQRLSISADISLSEAREYIDTYFALHSGIDKYIRSTKEQVAKQGYVETMFGRKRFFPNFHLLNQRERAEAERQAVNMPIQGTSADMIKKAMIAIDNIITAKFGYGKDSSVRMILQVHDELVFEVRKELLEKIVPIVKENMEGVAKLAVPIVVDLKVGTRWGSMKEL
ncbi:MAG: DNA polymerase I [Patescibacteria group bacterium]